MIEKLRWDTNYIIRNGELSNFFGNNTFQKNRKFLYILGEGFDPRMCFSLSKVLDIIDSKLIEILLIKYYEGNDSPSLKYQELVTGNMKEFNKMVQNKVTVNEKLIDLWRGEGNNKRRVGSINAFYSIDYNEIKKYSDIIIDISSLPRSIYFPVIRNIIYYIDNNKTKQNLFIVVTENCEMDLMIDDSGLDENASFIFGFEGKLEQESQSHKQIIWIPILGENKISHLEKVQNLLGEIDEICPLLPFPAINPRRGDNLIFEYNKFLFDNLKIENQNIIYAFEQNPFDVYRKINNTLLHYNNSLKIINGCNGVISTFSSKLLSIGALLSSVELNNENEIGVGIVNVEPQGYEIAEIEKFMQLNSSSECFAMWITGEPYEN